MGSNAAGGISNGGYGSAGGFGGNFSITGGPTGGSGTTGGSGGGGGAGFQTTDDGVGGNDDHGGAGGGLGGFGGAGGSNSGGAAGDGGGGGVCATTGARGGDFGAGNRGGGGFGGGGGGRLGVGGFGGGAGGSGSTAGGGGAGMGGGIFTMFGSLTIVNSTLSGNSAQGGLAVGGGGGSGYGGAIFNLDGNVTLTYTTIARNSALPGTGATNGNADGSGVYNLAYGNTLSGKANTAILSLNNSVIGQNNYYGLSHDLVSDAENGKNTNTAEVNGSSSVVQGGAVQAGNGTNLVANGAITVTSAPSLATALADNGGLTQTLAPNSNSPVLGAANPALSGLPSVDQRGVSRPSSTSPIKPDDGAYQAQSSPTTRPSTTTTITTLSVSSTYNSTTSQTATLSAAVAASNGGTVNEGAVTFTVLGTNLTATANVTSGAAIATLTLPAGFAAGSYKFSASYADSSGNYEPSTSATNGTLTVNAAATQTSLLSTAVNSTYNSGTPQSVTLSAAVTSASGGPVNEGAVTFSVSGTTLTATGVVNDGTATATLTVPAGFLAGVYSITASYADSSNANGVVNYGPSMSASNGTLTVNAATVTTTPVNIATVNPSNSVKMVTLAANVTSGNGGIVNEGAVTFTLIIPGGTNLTGTGNVRNGTATTTVTLPSGFFPGTYVYIASYADSKNVNGVPNYVASSGAGTIDPPDSGTATLTVVGSPPGNSTAPTPASSPTLQSPPSLSPQAAALELAIDAAALALQSDAPALLELQLFSDLFLNYQVPATVPALIGSIQSLYPQTGGLGQPAFDAGMWLAQDLPLGKAKS